MHIKEYVALRIIAEYKAKRKEYYDSGAEEGPHMFPCALEKAALVCERAISVRDKFGGDLDILLSDEIVKGLA